MSESTQPPEGGVSVPPDAYQHYVSQALLYAQQAVRLTRIDGADPAAVAGLAAIGKVFATLAAAEATRLRGER
jgi:hypothetical protein